MNFYLDEFQKINIGFKYKQIDLQMLQNIYYYISPYSIHVLY